ncbi:MAG: hotdog domain-containing protein, partial [Gammaproteobacteria bacterium]
FLRPVRVGATVSCYASVVKKGRSSMQIQVEVWTTSHLGRKDMQKVSEGLFVFVAIDDAGKPRQLPDA